MLGRTVPSFRMELEYEIEHWRGFRKSFRSQKELEAYDTLMDICRNNAMAAGSPCNPIVFETMVMSIVLAHQEKICYLEYGIQEVLWRETYSLAKPKKPSE